jgi:Holliday junction resolvase-like predicted endonuclease
MRMMNHKELTETACKWLKNQGCRVVISELSSSAGEEPDAIGWRSGVSILIECKTSRSDFKLDSKKIWRRKPNLGMGNWRFYLCEENLIKPHELINNGWGLLYVKNNKIKKIIAPKGNCCWYKAAPFESNKDNEIKILVSALSRKT